MLASLRDALPRAARRVTPLQARALHISSLYRPAASPLIRLRESSGIRTTRTASLTAVRFNSSNAPSVPVLDELSSSAASGTESVAEAVKSVAPDSLGYLKSLGLDYGFGPSNLMQSLLESAHVFGGLPWWGAIIASVVMVRSLQFPFYCKMSSNAARMKEVNPLLAPIMARMKAAQVRGDTLEMVQGRQEMSQMFKTAGVNRLWLFFPFTQIPIFYGFYRSLRGMAELPVPSFTTDGIAWFQDLSLADPTYFMPAATAGLIALQIGVGGEAGTNSMARSMKTGLMIALPMISFAVAFSWPAALVFYLLCNTAFGVLQSLLLRNSTFREKMGLYPLSVAASQNPLAVNKPINALNIASGAFPNKPIETPRKQIGGTGGFLDKLTGGDDEAGSKWSIQSWKDQASEKNKESRHKAYEDRRKKRLEEEKRARELKLDLKKRIRHSQNGQP